MSIYTGRSDDGSDMIEAQGMYVSPDGKEWSSMPYTKDQRAHAKAYRTHWEVFDHIAGKRSIWDEYQLILGGKSTLTKRCRDYVKNIFEK